MSERLFNTLIPPKTNFWLRRWWRLMSADRPHPQVGSDYSYTVSNRQCLWPHTVKHAFLHSLLQCPNMDQFSNCWELVYWHFRSRLVVQTILVDLDPRMVRVRSPHTSELDLLGRDSCLQRVCCAVVYRSSYSGSSLQALHTLMLLAAAAEFRRRCGVQTSAYAVCGLRSAVRGLVSGGTRWVNDREFRKFSGHPCIGPITRSSLR